jgi:ubiquinone/menaquinone biosynthesis C-methylase UbiE
MAETYYSKKLSAERLQRVYELAGPRVKQYLQAEIDHLAGFVQPGSRILELGCGYSRVLAPLAKIAGRGWGVDNAPGSLALAKTEHPELYPNRVKILTRIYAKTHIQAFCSDQIHIL